MNPILFLLQSAPAGGSSFLTLLPMVLIFAIFYFLLVLPMQRQRKKHQTMLQELRAGQQVQTSGGILGTIVSLDDNVVILRVKPDGVKLQVARSSIAATLSEDSKG
jgi:preprotein translocase subunit YajC